jgi:hypothetical protein
MLNKHNLRLANLATEEVSRYNLNCIKITPHETQVTDGHFAMRITNLQTDAEALTFLGGEKEHEGEVLLDASVASEIARLIPANRHRDSPENKVFITGVSEQGVEIRSGSFDSKRVFVAREGRGNFPNLDITIPQGEPVAQVAVNLPMLIAILQQISKSQDEERHPHVLISLYGDEKAFRLDAYNNATEQFINVILMPLRSSDVKLGRNYPFPKKTEDK